MSQMSSENPEPGKLSSEELLQENQALQRELISLGEQHKYLWYLFADTSRKLQVYSASIKAAVSSLLNYEFFWDSANQHEFLETINSSVNQVSELIVLQTLAFRAEAGSLVLKRDPQMLQEILSAAQAEAQQKFPDMLLKISYPVEGKFALVDYEYLVKALILLLEVYNANPSPEPVTMILTEEEAGWRLDISGLDLRLMQTIEQMHWCKTQPASIDFLLPENILRLHIFCEVLHLQGISVEVLESPDQPPVLRLWVEALKNP
jgi:hypothetical protein